MNRRNAGFTLIEMMIAMAIVMLVLYAAINFFIVSVRQYKVQTKIVETNVEGILGLELFRQDLENLGYGLPWNNLGTYSERTGNGSALNDAGGTAPKAVLSINGGGGLTVNGSDYLAVKSARVGMSDAAGKWTTLTKAGVIRTWSPNSENLIGADRVIVLSVGSTDSNRRSLVNNTSPYPTFATLGPSAAAFLPGEPYTANIVYGIDNGLPVRPFNRADYYIDNSVALPQRCAPNTGILVKEAVAHNVNGTTAARLPLLDCAADMQVVYGMDINGDGVVDSTYSDDITAMSAAAIRAQVVEVRVHILAQEGQRDDAYTYPYDNVTVGSESAGRTFDFATNGFASSGLSSNNFKHYRWKVYNIVVKPKNLAQ